MFGTLSYAGPKREAIYRPETAGYDTDNVQCGQQRKSELHRACQRCRSRKLKCSGEVRGCDRCRDSKSSCRYSPRAFRTSNPRFVADFSAGRGVPNCGEDMSFQCNTESTSTSTAKTVVETDVAYSSGSSTISHKDLSQFQWNQPAFDSSLNYSNTLSFLPHEQHDGVDASNQVKEDTWTFPGDFLSDVQEPYHQTWLDTTTIMTATLLAPGKQATTPPGEASQRSQSPNEQTDDRCQDLACSRCRCFDVITQYLEQSETQGNKGATLTIAEWLETSDVSRLRQTLSCSRCEMNSELVLVLVMLLRALGVVFTNMIYKALNGGLGGCEGDARSIDFINLGFNKPPRLIIDTCLIEDLTERILLLRALFQHRLRCLKDLIVITKSRVQSREGLISILLRVESQVDKLSRLVQ